MEAVKWHFNIYKRKISNQYIFLEMMFSGATNRSRVSHMLMKKNSFTNEQTERFTITSRNRCGSRVYCTEKVCGCGQRRLPLLDESCNSLIRFKASQMVLCLLKPGTWMIFLLLCPFVGLIGLLKGRHKKLWQSEVTMLKFRRKSRHLMSAVFVFLRLCGCFHMFVFPGCVSG